MMLAFVGLRFVLLAMLCIIRCRGKQYKIEIKQHNPVCTVDERFLSISIGAYHARQRFKAVDFTSQKLKNVIRALRPAYFRFGGSDANFLIFRPGSRLVQPTLFTTQTTPTTTQPTTSPSTTRIKTTTPKTTTEPTTTEKTTTTEATTTTEPPTTERTTTTTEYTTKSRTERPTTMPPSPEVPVATTAAPLPTTRPTPPPTVPVTTPPQSQLPNVNTDPGLPQGGWGIKVNMANGAGPSSQNGWGIKVNAERGSSEDERDEKQDSDKDDSRADDKANDQRDGLYAVEDIKQTPDSSSAENNMAQYQQYQTSPPAADQATVAQATGQAESADTKEVSKPQVDLERQQSDPPQAAGESAMNPPGLGYAPASQESQASSVHQEDNGNTAKRSPFTDYGRRMASLRNHTTGAVKRSGHERFPFWFAAEDLDRLAHFVQETGLKLIFDLNGFFRRPDGAWDATNAIDIVRHVKREGYDIAWELGNEPNRYGKYGHERVLSALQVAQDTIRLRSLLMRNEHYGSVLLGPGVSRPGTGNGNQFLREFLRAAAWAIDAVTWHQYYLSRRAKIDDFVDPKTMESFEAQIKTINKIVKESQSGKPVWLGETGSAWGGGAYGISSAFAASFTFLDKLGLAGLYCNQVVIRQSAIGGNYALLDDDFTPRPDYWVAFLHKKLVGRKVFPVVGGDRRVRVYAHCTKRKTGYPEGAITVIALNLWKKTVAKIKIKGLLGKQAVDEYLVTSSNGKLSSKSVDLNGEELHLTSGQYVPKLRPVQRVAPLKLPPLSYSFYVIPLANVRQCM